MSAPRPLRILFFALLAVSEGYYSARRGPSLFGVAEAIMGLLCAVIAWEQCVEGWREHKARRVARMLAERWGATGARTARRTGPRLTSGSRAVGRATASDRA